MIRQFGEHLSDIRADHVERYRFASEVLGTPHRDPIRVIDAGCGCGYGSQYMAQRGAHVLAFDQDRHAIALAKEYFPHPHIDYRVRPLSSTAVEPFDLLTMFEVIEHSRDAEVFLKAASAVGPMLIGSVPNEDVVPYQLGVSNPEHYRHFRFDEIRDLLLDCGWAVSEFWHQVGKEGADACIRSGSTMGRTLIFKAYSTMGIER